MAQTCPSCGRANPDGSRFCNACGSPLAGEPVSRREERKVVTVLFADLVGFTSRAEQLDPEDVRAMLSPYYRRLRRELERFGGTVEKFIGDAVMAVFGAPLTHEDDPERAVRAALAIRDWIAGEQADLRARVAVTTGEALVSLDARPDEGEGMVAGDVVNTAARLQSAAPVNGILVGEATYRATRGAVEYREHAPVAAKGKAQPIPVWEAVEARSRFGTDVEQAPSAPLLGREQELATLRAALDRARREREPQLVTLVGRARHRQEPPRLRALSPGRRGQRADHLAPGAVLPYGEGVTFWALGEMVKAQAGILENDPPAEAESKLRRAVEAAVPDRADWVAGHLRPLVGLATGDESGGDRQAEAFAAWRRSSKGLPSKARWCSSSRTCSGPTTALLGFIDHLVDWASGVPILTVCTARPELLAAAAAGAAASRTPPRSRSRRSRRTDTARLVHTLLERAVLPAEVQAAVLARAGGNPLYAEEFARMLAERGPAATPRSPYRSPCTASSPRGSTRCRPARKPCCRTPR